MAGSSVGSWRSPRCWLSVMKARSGVPSGRLIKHIPCYVRPTGGAREFPHTIGVATYGVRMNGRDERVEEWDPDDDHDDDTPPHWFAGAHLPPEARGMGLTHHTQEGALLDFAGSLDSSKRFHRVVAWLMLVVFGLPVVFYILRLVLSVVQG